VPTELSDFGATDRMNEDKLTEYLNSLTITNKLEEEMEDELQQEQENEKNYKELCERINNYRKKKGTMLKTNKNLFKLLDTFQRQNPNPKEIGNINYRLFYSELLNLFIVVDDNNEYKFYKPLDRLEDLQDDEANLIRKTLHIKPADMITYKDLFYTTYVDGLKLTKI